MKRTRNPKFDTMSLVVDRAVNFREDYDIPSMIEEIKQLGRIIEPIHARKEDNVVLKGNRRTLAAQMMLQDPKLPSDLKDSLEKMDVIFYEGLDEKEQNLIILDHGSQKPLSRVETVGACWRLQKLMYSEVDIIIALYHLLAKYTGNPQKMYEAAALPEGPARIKFLKDWLHGTVGNYILAAGRMGERIRKQFILTDRAKDRQLTLDEQKEVEFKTDRVRINQLASARKRDQEAGKWDIAADSGPEFEAKIKEFIDIDKGVVAPDTPRKPTATELESTGDAMSHPDLKKLFLQCAGKLPTGQRVDINSLDAELMRTEHVRTALKAAMDRVNLSGTYTGAEVRELMRLFLFGVGPEVAKYVERFVS